MARIAVQLLPFVIGGAFLPTWTSYVILLLGTERPLGTASAYVAGNATWRLVLGVAAVFVVSVTAPEAGRRGFALPTGLTWLVAVLFIVAGLWLVARKPATDSARETRLSKWISTFRRFPPWAAFGYGVYNCAMPGAQWAYFLGGCGVIASSGLSWEWRIALLALFIVLLEAMLVAPIVVYARKREAARAGLVRLERWLAHRAATVIGGILIIVGALFIYIALEGGRIGGTG